jgi:hypothetical protein
MFQVCKSRCKSEIASLVCSRLGREVCIQQILEWHERDNTIWQAAPLLALFLA